MTPELILLLTDRRGQGRAVIRALGRDGKPCDDLDRAARFATRAEAEAAAARVAAADGPARWTITLAPAEPEAPWDGRRTIWRD
jgi:hypothetical protein